MAIVESGEEFIITALPPRQNRSRKGENGIVAVIGGSAVFHGAPSLAALGALRTGIDIAYLFVPQSISIPIRSISPNFIVFPLPDSKITIGTANRILNSIPTVDSVVIGPGTGRQKPDGIRRLVMELSSRGVKLVIDADALVPEVINVLKGKEVVLTPHAGEFMRLFGSEVEDNDEQRLNIVQEMARENDLTILLKGTTDVISDGKVHSINRSGNPAMTVGGTGDVLAGIIAALMARGMKPFQAAISGAYINGKAGELAYENLGFSVLATDLIDQIPILMKRFDRIDT